MKNLIDIYSESILDDVDSTMQKFDNTLKQAEDELNYFKNITWEDIVDIANFYDGKIRCTFKIKCPNVLALFGINHPDADGLIIDFRINNWYDINVLLTIKHKNQRNYNTSKISKSWIDLSHYAGPIHPRQLSTAVLRIRDVMHEIANIETLISINSNNKIYN